MPRCQKSIFHVITIDAIVSPAIVQHVTNSISDAQREGAQGLIIPLDTPGGLELAMCDIAKSILNAPLPVIVFVTPAGARAASAGVIITISAHVAAITPGTNIGASHPVSVGIGSPDKVMM